MKATITLRNTGTIEPFPENEDYVTSKAAAGGIDKLGMLPMGTGRADIPNKAYTNAIQVIAEVNGFSLNTLFRWRRWISRRSWIIKKDAEEGKWLVEQRSQRGFRDDDTGNEDFNDATPSLEHNRIYIYDNSALIPTSGISANLRVGGYVYEEKDFLYQVQYKTDKNWINCAEQHIGQVMLVKRKAIRGDFAEQWEGIENSIELRKLNVTITKEKVRAIVGGNLPIEMDENENDSIAEFD